MAGGWGQCGARVLLAGAMGFALVSVAYCVNPNEREVKPQVNVLDPDGINKPGGRLWVFDFKFKDPRLIKVDIPGRGQKLCLYLWYQVINNSPDPQTFNPRFELVTQDPKKLPRRDQILPRVQEEIIKIEDSPGYLKIKNSVTIAAEPIPPTRRGAKTEKYPEGEPIAMPHPVTGVAIWDDVDFDSNRFDIFVSGLSNGYNISFPVGREEKPVVLQKTLQLRFRRFGDKALMRSEDIRFIDPPQWIYRASDLPVPDVLRQQKDK